MKHYLKPVYAFTVFALLTTTSVQAENQEKMVIALKTHDFELTETDISTLAIGESQTIETGSGKIIDILRTTDGAEIYVDGELLEIDFDHEGLHEDHMIKKHVSVICDNNEDCDKNIFILAGDDDDSNRVIEDAENIFIHKEIEISCSDDEDRTSCTDKMVWMSEDGNINHEELHEMHMNGEGHKVIVIRNEIVTED